MVLWWVKGDTLPHTATNSLGGGDGFWLVYCLADDKRIGLLLLSSLLFLMGEAMCRERWVEGASHFTKHNARFVRQSGWTKVRDRERHRNIKNRIQTRKAECTTVPLIRIIMSGNHW